MVEEPAAPRIIYPRINDPRWVQIACLGAFLLLYLSYAPAFHRSPGQILAAFAGCLGLDVLLLLRRRLPLVPLSGLMTALWTVVLIDSASPQAGAAWPQAGAAWPQAGAASPWAYALAGGMATFSKHFIRVKGEHLFVPNNFGAVATLLLFPGHAALTAQPWTGPSAGLSAAACLGLVAAKKAGRPYVPLSFLAVFLLGALLRRCLGQADAFFPLSAAAGPAFHLFAFFHLSDPKATPAARVGQLAYGGAAGLLDALLRLFSTNAAVPYLALFLIAWTLPAFRRFDPDGSDRSWRLGYAPLPRRLADLLRD